MGNQGEVCQYPKRSGEVTRAADAWPTADDRAKKLRSDNRLAEVFKGENEIDKPGRKWPYE